MEWLLVQSVAIVIAMFIFMAVMAIATFFRGARRALFRFPKGDETVKAIGLSVLAVALPILVYLPLEALGVPSQLAGQVASIFTIFILVAFIASQVCSWLLEGRGPYAEMIVLAVMITILLCVASRWAPEWITPIGLSALPVLVFEFVRHRLWVHPVG
ncbi:MAG: hypothetical protein ACOX50_04300 [Patescibacteria group bacterium]|jgi:hypothetical protein